MVLWSQFSRLSVLRSAYFYVEGKVSGGGEAGVRETEGLFRALHPDPGFIESVVIFHLSLPENFSKSKQLVENNFIEYSW